MKDFIREHINDDLMRLLLNAKRYPDVDVPFAVEQIAARRQIKDKLPAWYANEYLLFPTKLAAEQCSSELTARYKQELVGAADRMYDLTGGLGIDSYYFSRKAKHLTYIERFPDYCEAARHNFQVLKAENITVCHAESSTLLPDLPPADVIYIDPARRGESDKRVYALADCEPNLPKLLEAMFRVAPKVIAKLSPMVDIAHTISQLSHVRSVHILSVKNECKELLFVMERDGQTGIEPFVPAYHCVNFNTKGELSCFSFQPDEEPLASVSYAEDLKTYLYEPNASVLKAGAFRSVALRFGLLKLHKSSHLYTSDTFVDVFPGRVFRVKDVYPFSGKLCKNIAKEIPQANLTVRNFPLKVDELRKRMKIREGGDVYLFATICSSGEKILISCVK